MPSTRDEVNDFLMGSGVKAFPFEEIGDSVQGIITDMTKQQQTNMETQEPLYWQNGDPRMMLRVTLETNLREGENDEGMRSVYLRGGNFTVARGKGNSSLQAVKDAVKRSGSAKGIEEGGLLTLTYTGEGTRPNKGMNPPKLYSAEYAPPSGAVDLDEMA